MISIPLLAVCLLPLADEPTPLFDGVSLSGWSGNPETWWVEDGMIVGASRAEAPLPHNEYLFWDGVASDFVLELDIRLLGGNSGIQYRSRRRGQHDVEGYQADLDADNTYTGILYETAGRGIMSRRGEKRAYLFQDNHRDLGMIPGTEDPPIQPHEWNRYRIVADGAMLSHYINDRLLSQVVDEDPERRRHEGNIALQVHSGPPMRIEVRNISIQPLNGTTITPPSPQPHSLVQEPEWIWCSQKPGDDEQCTLTRTFRLDAPATDLHLRIACDNTFTASLDGTVVATGTDWQRPVSVHRREPLPAGEHALTIECRNEGGPAGLLVEMTWSTPSGTGRLVSDPDWRLAGSGERATSFGPASSPQGPWPDVFAGGRPAATGLQGDLQVPEGFTVETLYEAGTGEGSWVAMAFDDTGRLIVSSQYGKMYRLTLPGPGGSDVQVEPIDLEIGAAQGLLYTNGALYAMVTRKGEDGGGIWRLRDTTGDDQYDSMEHLAAWGAGNEHGNHAMVLGPDGLIYVIQGNLTPLPPDINPRSAFRNWAEDDLLPRLWDANGHAVGVMTPGGVVMRTDPEATQFEIVAGGLRNAYDLAFNDTGDLFTWDSDMEWDLGTPWYRPPRALHVTSGGEFGWRGGTAKWPDWYPDSLPTMALMPQGSPTGMVFGGDSSFPEPWKSALFLADWTYGRVFVVHLEEDGAGWTGQEEIFAAGRPFNVSDMAFGPDGHLYLVTGGRGTHSALYRINGTSAPAGVAPERSPEAARLRAQRQSMESLHHAPAPGRIGDIQAALRSDDRLVRYAARVALERQPVEQWRDLALSEQHPAAALEMLLALSRQDTANSDRVNQVITRALQIGESSTSADRQRNAMRVIALAMARYGPPSEPTRDAARDWVRQLSHRSDINTKRLAMELLVRLESPSLPAELVAVMESAPTQEDALHAALLLRLVPDDWSDDLRRRYLQWLYDHRSITGGRSIGGFVKAIEAGARETWGPDHSARIEKLVQEQPPASRESHPRVNSWTVSAVEPHLPEMESGRDFASGRRAYRQARCFDCHRFHGTGGSTGPDLTGIGSRFTDRDLLEALIEPSKVIADQYEATMVIRTDDTIDTGRLLESNENQVILNVDPYGYETLAIPRSEVAEMLPSPVSTMPVGSLDVLELEEILDLMAYLQSSGDPSNASFARSGADPR
ncbi:MAG: DUF1080 domain-containing protein [Phycisphaerales bacterium]|nr:DUF1080 domain-containing protein [Phycisphaerales bacterium]